MDAQRVADEPKKEGLGKPGSSAAELNGTNWFV